MIYKSEYDDCVSIKARFNQYFTFGKYLDCNQWNTDYHNCYQWKKHKSQEAYVCKIELFSIKLLCIPKLSNNDTIFDI